MKHLENFRRSELVFVFFTTLLFVTSRLFLESRRFGNLKSISTSAGYPEIASYNYFLNNVLPFVTCVVLIFTAWYILHFVVHPKIKAKEYDRNFLIYLSVVLAAVIGGILIYHHFMIHIDFKMSPDKKGFIGLQVNSLVHKRVILVDIIGTIIILGLYELFFDIYYNFLNRLKGEKGSGFKYLANIIIALIAIFILFFALLGYLPYILWREQPWYLMLTTGLLALIYLLQFLLYQNLFPIIQNKPSYQLKRPHVYYFITGWLGSVLIWGAYITHLHISGIHDHQVPIFKSGSTLVDNYIQPIKILLIVSICCSYIAAYLRWTFKKEQTDLQHQLSKTSAELSNLRAQINPHFLFNAHNSLYAAALKEGSSRTADGIQKLSDMMRFMLKENNQDRIPLDKEIEYLQNYITIQRMRIHESKDIDIKVNIQQPEHCSAIAPMMLNPFVENAFKHGISLKYPSWIYITLSMDVKNIYLKVHNSLHKKQENDPEKDRLGVGLSNVKKRLELIYPNRHTLEIQKSETDFFVSLTLECI